MKYKAVCFDIDGTLYPPKIMNRLSFKAMIPYPYLSFKYKQMRSLFRKIQPDFENLKFEDISLRKKEAMFLSAVTKNRWSVEKSKDYLDNRYYKKLQESYKRLPFQEDSVETLRKLRQKGIKIGVFTDWPLFDKLERLGVSGFVDFCASSTDVKYLKPDSHCFDYMVSGMGLRADEVLYVGDSYKKDVCGAYDFGIDAVLVNCRKKNTSLFPKAVKVFQNWKDFDEWLTILMEEN